MAIVQQGTTNLSSTIQWGPDELAFGPDGFRTTRTGVGQHAICVTEASTLQAAGWEGNVSRIGTSPNSQITATIAALDPDNPDDNLLPKWGLDVQYENVPAELSQSFKAYITANGGNNGTTFRSIVAAVAQYETEQVWTLYDALGTTPKAWAYDIINRRTVREFKAILRRTNTYAGSTSQTADWVDVGKVFTTAQIVALTDPPSSIIGTLPTTYWLKSPAPVDDGADGRYTVTTLWISGTVEDYPSHQYTYKT